MARSFSDNYLSIDSAVLSGVPMTMACWFNSSNATLTQYLMCLVDKDVTTQFHALFIQGSAVGDPVCAYSFAGTGAYSTTTTGYSINTWHHACGVWSATNSRKSYIDAGSVGENTTDLTPVGLDRTAIGKLMRSTPGGPFYGRIAEAGIWNVVLDTSEISALARGALPLRVRPGSLVAYWPLWGRTSPEIDPVGKYDMTVVGATAADHCRTVRAMRRWSRIAPTVASAIAAIMDGYRRRR